MGGDIMVNESERYEVATDALRLVARTVPWDSEVFGFPVAAIETIDVIDRERSRDAFLQYQDWINDRCIEFVSCRLPHDCVATSMYLEWHGFRFIEMVLHPRLNGLNSLPEIKTTVCVEPALKSDIPVLAAMAERAFGYERYHVDPRVDSRLADLRYGRWIRHSFDDEKQVLLKIVRGNDIVGFFVIENRFDRTVYWHLTAINPDFRGQNLGKEVWAAMLAFHRNAGMSSVLTTISARNSPVLNLYSKLNFRFEPPEITLHWCKGDR
jgi:RimJ/RimL family protein N-acetyltransferase